MTTCGWELEISAGRYSVLDGLLALGLTEHENYHGYHCGCRQCQPRPFYGANQRWFKAQDDCTADGEIISGIFEYGSDEMNEAILGQSHVLLRAGASTVGNVGNHVHVGRDALDNAAEIRLQRLFGRYAVDLQEIAAGPFDNMRTYNGRIRIPASSEPLWTAASDWAGPWGGLLARTDSVGHTIAFKRHTIEFRLWNSVKAAWRIRTHVGLSVAFVDAALAGQDATYNDTRPLEDVIGDFMDADTWAGVLRQRYSKGGLQ